MIRWCLYWNIKMCLAAFLLLFCLQPVRAMEADDQKVKNSITSKKSPGVYEDLMKPKTLPQRGIIYPTEITYDVPNSVLCLSFTSNEFPQPKKAMLKLERDKDEFVIVVRGPELFLPLQKYKTPLDTDDLFNYLFAWCLIDEKNYEKAIQILEKLSVSSQLAASLKNEAETYSNVLKDPKFMKKWEPDLPGVEEF